ncbi:MAG: hypothetical protein JSV09_06840 [Thermoplasmata archaeon]|nr:MAG: hypothetical protein JSV09_06840 [Thermoplasmata archaeon]
MANSIVAFTGVILFAVILVILLIISVIITAILSRKGKKYLGRIITGCLLLIFALSLLIGFWNNVGIIGPALNAEDVATQEIDGDFTDYDKGDIITIRDEITRMETQEFNNKTYVIIWFESSGSEDDDFKVIFKDDISGNYNEGDIVVVFLEIVHYNASSDQEVLKYHAPNREQGARSYQIYPSLYADIWFWLILIIGVVEIVLGLVGWKKRKPEEEIEGEPIESEELPIEGRKEIPHEELPDEESGELGGDVSQFHELPNPPPPP